MRKLILTLTVLLTLNVIFFSGCSDEGTGGGVVTDPNVKVYRGLAVHQFNTATSLSGVNLLTGTVVSADNNMKDIHLSDSNSTGVNFFFRSGILGMDSHGNLVVNGSLAGMETMFGTTIAYMDMTQAQFDTITRIPVSGNLGPNNFLNDRTNNYPEQRYFNAPLQNRTVYSFWLKGKSAIATDDIYGILYLKSAEYVSGDFRVTIDVKINTAGQNNFRELVISS